MERTMLLFDPQPPLFRWARFENGGMSEGTAAELGSAMAGRTEGVEAVAYLLYHGGPAVKTAAQLLTRADLSAIEQSIQFFPEQNGMTYVLAKYWLELLPDVPHVLMCETGFFMDLPPEASLYAIPFELCQQGVRRFGGFGLCHEWAWKQARSMNGPSTRRLVSVFLGDNTNIAAIGDGKPIETTVGLTPAEGIPSAGGCGDVDPTLVGLLLSEGMSFEEIRLLLSEESGFTGLLGRACSYRDIISRNESADLSEVRSVYLYSIKKYIGALAATLGGIDTIAFVTQYPEDSQPLIQLICEPLVFLGLKLRAEPARYADGVELTTSESSVRVLCFAYKKWQILAERAEIVLHQ